MSTETALLARVAEVQRDTYNRVRTTTDRAIGALWDRRGGVTDDALRAWLAAAVPTIETAQVAAAQVTTRLLAESLRIAGEPTAAVAVGQAPIAATELRGLPTAAVYTRPVITARAGLAEGTEYVQAMIRARALVRSIASADIALAQRAAMAGGMKAAGGAVAGYRRTLTGLSCVFCATASTQRYHDRSLMPIHAHCDCGVAPIIGDHDPGRVVNRQLLAKIKTGEGPSYWKERGWIDTDGDIIDPSSPAARQLAGTTAHGELGATFDALAAPLRS